MKKSNFIRTAALCSFSAATMISFCAGATFLGNPKAYDIWVKPDTDKGYKVTSSVGGGTAPNFGSNKKKVVEAICKAANNNGRRTKDPASGDSTVHPPAAWVPGQAPSPKYPKGTLGKFKGNPKTTLKKCCVKKGGNWVPLDKPDAVCTEGVSEESEKEEEADKAPLAILGLE